MLLESVPMSEGRAQGEKPWEQHLEVRFCLVGSPKPPRAKAAILDLSTEGITLLTTRRCVPGAYLAIELHTPAGRVLEKMVGRVQKEQKGLTAGDWVVECAFLAGLSRRGLPAATKLT